MYAHGGSAAHSEAQLGHLQKLELIFQSLFFLAAKFANTKNDLLRQIALLLEDFKHHLNELKKLRQAALELIEALLTFAAQL